MSRGETAEISKPAYLMRSEVERKLTAANTFSAVGAASSIVIRNPSLSIELTQLFPAFFRRC